MATGLPIVTLGGGRTTSLRLRAAGKKQNDKNLNTEQNSQYVSSELAMATTVPALENRSVPPAMLSSMLQGTPNPYLLAFYLFYYFQS